MGDTDRRWIAGGFDRIGIRCWRLDGGRRGRFLPLSQGFHYISGVIEEGFLFSPIQAAAVPILMTNRRLWPGMGWRVFAMGAYISERPEGGLKEYEGVVAFSSRILCFPLHCCDDFFFVASSGEKKDFSYCDFEIEAFSPFKKRSEKDDFNSLAKKRIFQISRDFFLKKGDNIFGVGTTFFVGKRIMLPFLFFLRCRRC